MTGSHTIDKPFDDAVQRSAALDKAREELAAGTGAALGTERVTGQMAALNVMGDTLSSMLEPTLSVLLGTNRSSMANRLPPPPPSLQMMRASQGALIFSGTATEASLSMSSSAVQQFMSQAGGAAAPGPATDLANSIHGRDAAMRTLESHMIQYRTEIEELRP